MTRGRHSLAPPASKNRRLAFLAAPVVTCAVVGVGVAGSGIAASRTDVTTYAASDLAATAPIDGRTVGTSRASDRSPAASVPAVTTTSWTTAAVDLRGGPRAAARVVGEVPALSKVQVTGQQADGFAQVVVGQQVLWVTARYLAATKPTDPAHLGLSDKPCPDMSVEHGLTARAVLVYRAVCNNFPQITSYGGWAARGEHASGKAIDVMISDVQVGYEVADFLRAHAAQLDLYDVIWRQHIWTPVRAAEGWRPMPDRGSATANHYNHVHVSVN